MSRRGSFSKDGIRGVADGGCRRGEGEKGSSRRLAGAFRRLPRPGEVAWCCPSLVPRAVSVHSDSITQRTIITPFSSWSASHDSRLSASRQTLFSHLTAYETALSHVQRLKTSYIDACHTADEVEDEWNFVRGKEELGGKWAPRPDEVDEAAPAAGRRARRSAEEAEDDEKGDEEEGLVGRSGATGGSVLGALGRALTVRRAGAGRSTRSTAQEAEKDDDEDGAAVVAPVLEEAKERIGKVLETKEVKAGLDWSKNK